jgi:CubicO group peptidase (beta-lactamase class C family)/D-alanyl-D-alanine dipeptidase
MQENIQPRQDYSHVVEKLEEAIAYEMEDKDLPAISIALVDDQEIVWAQGFGMADPDEGIPATAGTVHRIASLSKLFTDMAVMQLAERGDVDIDAPITDYLPEFQPRNSFDREITLRQIMSHRSGIVREPPVGHYFDPTEPTVAQLVESLNSTDIVYEPESRTKYSNAAISVAGYAVEKLEGQSFDQYMQTNVLDPIGMSRSSYVPKPEIIEHLAVGYMWGCDGRVFEAPTFELGMVPAAGMYSTAKDLAEFMKMLFNGGTAPGGQILQPETLEKMWEIQYAEEGQQSGFGLGFYVGQLDGKRQIGHGGVMYGYATGIEALPDEKLGVVTVITLDAVNSVAGRINNYAFRLMTAKRAGEPLPGYHKTGDVPEDVARQLEGRFSDQRRTIELVERNGELHAYYGSIRTKVKSIGDTLLTDGRQTYGRRILLLDNDRILVNGETLTREPSRKPEPIPARWKGLIGEYGWDHNILFILEKKGKLFALIEWFFYYPLEEISQDVFAFPNFGLYHGEKLIFTRDAAGRATEVEAASVVFKRRAVGADEGATFKIEPLSPGDELREIALAAQPPEEDGEFLEPDLVDLSALDTTIKFDIRYSTTNNFMSTVFYDQAKALMQRPAADALVRAHQNLKDKGYGLLIHDAYRPWYVTKMFWDATPEEYKIFVAPPSEGSRHNRGCAVDVTLYELNTGEAVQMVGGYDEFSERSYPDYPGGTSEQRWLRELLRDAVEAEGFEVYKFEWWHFDYLDWRKYSIGNLTFEDILGEVRAK